MCSAAAPGPDDRPIRKGKLDKPTERVFVDQLWEITANTQRGARVRPTAEDQAREQAQNTLLPASAAWIG